MRMCSNFSCFSCLWSIASQNYFETLLSNSFLHQFWISECRLHLELANHACSWCRSSFWVGLILNCGYILLRVWQLVTHKLNYWMLGSFPFHHLISVSRLLTEDPNHRLGAGGALEVILICFIFVITTETNSVPPLISLNNNLPKGKNLKCRWSSILISGILTGTPLLDRRFQF